MAKVWVVLFNELHEGSSIEGIFDTKEKAEIYEKEHNIDCGSNWTSVEEYELQ